MSALISNDILKFTDKLVSVSDFSKGRTSQIFDDVKNNHAEYIVLKNNQPTALVISLDNYRELIDKASKMEMLLDKIEDSRLLEMANDRIQKAGKKMDFADVIKKFGFSQKEILDDFNDVELE